jgi:thioredoxin reductase
VAGAEVTEVAVVGGGPAGLSAALAARRAGADVVLIDENAVPGGQLRKQIHKFFGSRAHHAGVRGFRIAAELGAACRAQGVALWMDTVAYGLFNRTLGVAREGTTSTLTARSIVLATGAGENALAFPGCTLPGVMGAGAVQTFVNLHRVLPGRRTLMVGAGNVGLIVSYQLLQAGAEVLGVVEAAPHIGGYAVHAAKLRRAGVPIWTRHTVLAAAGGRELEAVTIAALDDNGRPVRGSEQTFAVDLICLAVGLTPLTELAWQAGCRFAYSGPLGGHVPLHNADMETTVPGLFVAGDAAGVEEASTALEEGRLAGLAAAAFAGRGGPELEAEKEAARRRLEALRSGPFGGGRRRAQEEIVKGWLKCSGGRWQ